jgi:hypothetical protein
VCRGIVAVHGFHFSFDHENSSSFGYSAQFRRFSIPPSDTFLPILTLYSPHVKRFFVNKSETPQKKFSHGMLFLQISPPYSCFWKLFPQRPKFMQSLHTHP